MSQHHGKSTRRSRCEATQAINHDLYMFLYNVQFSIHALHYFLSAIGNTKNRDIDGRSRDPGRSVNQILAKITQKSTKPKAQLLITVNAGGCTCTWESQIKDEVAGADDVDDSRAVLGRMEAADDEAAACEDTRAQ